MHGGDGVLNLLAQLVNKSLVETETTPGGERYGLHETIRQYAREKLAEAGEEARARRRHFEYFAGLAQTASTHWQRPQAKVWLDRLETELDNLRVALDGVARDGDAQAGAQLIGWVYYLWFCRGYVLEGMRWIEAILPPRAPMSDATRVRRLLWLGELAHRNCDFAQATDKYVEAAALASQLGDDRLLLWTKFALSWVTADHAEATRLLDEMLRLARLNKWKVLEALAVFQLGRRLRIAGDYQGAADRLAACDRLLRESGELRHMENLQGQLGLLACARGDYVQARSRFDESVALAREAGDTVGVADWLVGLSTAAVYQDDYPSAIAALREGITTHYTMGNLYRVPQCLAIAAHVAQDRGQPERAARLLGAAAAIWQGIPSAYLWVEPEFGVEYERRLPAVRAVLDPRSFDSAWGEGLHMTPQQAVAYALQGGEADEPPVR